MRHVAIALGVLVVVIGFAVSLDPRGALTFLGYITLLFIALVALAVGLGVICWGLYKLFALSKGGFE